MKKYFLYAFLILVSCSNNSEIENTNFTIWDGPEITFTKASDTNPNIPENQDRITDNVWITRNTIGGEIYNAVSETVSTKGSSPLHTKWAIGEISNIANLEFFSFRTAVGKPKDIVGINLVLYLEKEDVYIPLTFIEWDIRKSGGFAYRRGTKN